MNNDEEFRNKAATSAFAFVMEMEEVKKNNPFLYYGFPAQFGDDNEIYNDRMELLSWYSEYFKNLGSISEGTQKVKEKIDASFKGLQEISDTSRSDNVFTVIGNDLEESWTSPSGKEFRNEYLVELRETITRQGDALEAIYNVIDIQEKIIFDTRENFIKILESATEKLEEEQESGNDYPVAKTVLTVTGTILSVIPKTAAIGATILSAVAIADGASDSSIEQIQVEVPHEYGPIEGKYVWETVDSLLEKLNELLIAHLKQSHELVSNADVAHNISIGVHEDGVNDFTIAPPVFPEPSKNPPAPAPLPPPE